jgi:hypothetical protein
MGVYTMSKIFLTIAVSRRRCAHRERCTGNRLAIWQHFSQYVSVVPWRRGAIRDQSVFFMPPPPPRGTLRLGALLAHDTSKEFPPAEIPLIRNAKLLQFTAGGNR